MMICNMICISASLMIGTAELEYKIFQQKVGTSGLHSTLTLSKREKPLEMRKDAVSLPVRIADWDLHFCLCGPVMLIISCNLLQSLSFTLPSNGCRLGGHGASRRCWECGNNHGVSLAGFHLFCKLEDADRDKMRAASRDCWAREDGGLIGSWDERVADTAVLVARVTRSEFPFYCRSFSLYGAPDRLRRVLLRV
jgi:hypothetical protein